VCVCVCEREREKERERERERKSAWACVCLRVYVCLDITPQALTSCAVIDTYTMRRGGTSHQINIASQTLLSKKSPAPPPPSDS